MKILTYRFTFPSAKLLRDALQKRTNKKIIVTKYPDKITGKFIRYGNSLPVSGDDTEFNTPRFIKFCSNKLSFSRLMKRKGISSPVYTARDVYPNKEVFPVLIRVGMEKMGGDGIYIVENMEDYIEKRKKLFENYFWTPFTFVDHEVRVHVLNTKNGIQIPRVFRKLPKPGIKKEKYPIRVSSNYDFSLRSDFRYRKTLKNLVTKLMQIPEFSVGKFLALDIGFNNKNDFIIFEANSAPGLNPYTAEVYAEFLADEAI
jgi:hypothetical protein